MNTKKLLPLALVLLCSFSLFARGKSADSGSAAGSGNVRELRYGFISEPSTLDPLSPSNTADGRSILFNVFEGLVRVEPDGGLQPAVASAFAVEQGGLVYRFTLRQGLRFHNGQAVTVEDVKFSLDKAIEAKYQGLVDQVERVETPDSSTIIITLKAPDVEFLPFLTISVVPANNLDREHKPIGTGPYSIESYTPQQSLVLKKNPGYWKPGFPKLDKVTIVFLADSDALLLSLRGGNIDGATVTGPLVEQLGTTNFDVFSSYSNSVQLLALNNSVKPLDDIRVRQAVNYAVDVQEIVDTAFYGRGEASGSPLIPGLAKYYNKDLVNPYPRNVERSRALLREAGLANGFPLEITVPSNYTMHVDTAQVLVNQLEQVGIKATIRLVDWATWLADVYRGREYAATVISLDAPNSSPRTFLSRYLSTGGSNFVNFKNADYDRVFNSILSEIDETKRIALYRDAQKIISDSAASVYIQDIYGFKVFPRGRYSNLLNYPLYVIDFASITPVTPK
ncbi:MAG: ABC transporter substrate-binding protein [Treponema sp.]|jgi:peptide/nickel transport system substrate-binding protein|nr:ABC transporter substrate-binding protein [Treponema sp.]